MNRILSIAGIAGGIFWFSLHTYFVADWGPPGTAAYERYELFNRLWTPGLLLVLLGFVGFYRSLRHRFAGGQRGGMIAVLIGLTMMIIGNAAEFWLFSEQSYTGVGRNLSWTTFLLGLLVLFIGAIVVGLNSFRTGLIPRWVALLLLLFPPLTFIGIWQEISLLSNGLFSLVAVLVAGLGLWHGLISSATIDQNIQKHEPTVKGVTP